MISTSPDKVAASAGPEPLNGTCVIWIPARFFSSSATREGPQEQTQLRFRRQWNHWASIARFVHRLHCLLLVGAGRSCYEVAVVFGDDPRSVERWVREFQQHGIDGLREKPHPGRHATLADAQMRQLELVLKSVPSELGYPADVWSNKLLRAEILRRFGVTLSARHCQRLFRIIRQSRPQETN